MGELLLLSGASIYVLALLVYIFRVFLTQKFLALVMLFFPPLVFVNVFISRLKFAVLVFYQLLGLIILGSGVAIEYPHKIAEYTGLNVASFHSEDLHQNRVVRIKNSAGKSSALAEKRNLPRDQAGSQNLASSADEKEKSTLEPELLTPEPSASATEGLLRETHQEEMLSPTEEMPDDEPVFILSEEPLPREVISSVDPSDDEASFWQEEEEDESMLMGDLLETPVLGTFDDNEGGADLKQSTPSSAKPQESLPVDTLSQAEDRVVARESRLIDEPPENTIEAKEKKVPVHILEERERVRKKQLEMDLLAESLQAKIGKMITVEKYNAKKEEGKLLSVNSKKLALEKRIGAGTMESFIKLEDIKKVGSAP